MKKKALKLLLFLIIIAGVIFLIEKQKPSSQYDLPPVEKIVTKKGAYPEAPELTGISGYLNTEEGLTLESLKGKVVLIDFWTYTCINCIRTLPFLVMWDDKYRDMGLVVIGVHTPEFLFEHDYENVEKALSEHGITYPVVQDNDYATWRAFNNRYWPHKYLIDKEGFIRYDHIGEGGYVKMEQMIQELLDERGEDVSDMPRTMVEDTTPQRKITPELYAGYQFALQRKQNIGNEEKLEPNDTIKHYILPETIEEDTIYLDGIWLSTPQDLDSISANPSSVVVNFTAQSVHIIADPFNSTAELEIRINGKFITKEQAGSDVVFDDEYAYIPITEPRMYTIVDGEYGNYLLELTTTADSFTFHAFTFG